jgi:hypothetical protein
MVAPPEHCAINDFDCGQSISVFVAPVVPSQIRSYFDSEFERFTPAVGLTAGRDNPPGKFLETEEQFFVKGEHL